MWHCSKTFAGGDPGETALIISHFQRKCLLKVVKNEVFLRNPIMGERETLPGVEEQKKPLLELLQFNFQLFSENNIINSCFVDIENPDVPPDYYDSVKTPLIPPFEITAPFSSEWNELNSD